MFQFHFTTTYRNSHQPEIKNDGAIYLNQQSAEPAV